MTQPNPLHTRPGRFFMTVTRRPWTVLLVAAVAVVACGSFIPTLEKDTTAEAFIPDDHPVLVYRDRVDEIFGLKDPMVIGVTADGEHGVFNPHTLELVNWLSKRVERVDGVDPERVMSLATENDIEGTAAGLAVEPFFETPPATQAGADRVARAIGDFPLYQGSLVARDGSATLIIAELLDQDQATAVYRELRALADEAPVASGESVHVAGEGAVRGFLSTYIDRDSSRLNPWSALIITFVLFIAFRTLRGVVLPNLVVLATVAGALGLIAAAGVDFYVITNSLPVILIGIAVADSIHILSQYYEELAARPDTPQRELVVRAMVAMWRPITLTTVTTMAGFVGLAAASTNMPPMVYYGIFAALGVAIAWLYSLLVVPAGLSLLRPRPSGAYRPPVAGRANVDPASRALQRLGGAVGRHAGKVAAVTLTIAAVAAVGASRLEMDYERIDNFRASEPIHRADRVINRHFDGSKYLDVVVETPGREDLFEPENLQRIDALQDHMESLPHVNGTTSVVDYLKQMNKTLNGGADEAYALPDSKRLTAQYFLLYGASGDPTDFEDEITYDYRQALVRARLDTGRYQAVKPVVREMERYLREELDTEGIEGHLTGTVHLTYHWLRPLAANHFTGLALALALVWAVSALWFRSALAGALAATPVAFAVLVVYAVMGFTGIWLSVGSSMFAAIAIGLGVDFAIHAIERLRALLREERHDVDAALPRLYAATGRALLFNFLALSLGFGVLMVSYVPPLNRFGLLVATAVATSFIASLTLLPALVKLLRPREMGFSATTESEVDDAHTASR